MLERDPLPFLSDLMLADFVKHMQRVSEPVFSGAFADDDRRWFRERLTITAVGASSSGGRGRLAFAVTAGTVVGRRAHSARLAMLAVGRSGVGRRSFSK